MIGNALLNTPSPRDMVFIRPHSDWVSDLQCQLLKNFADDVDTFCIYSELGNNECKEM